MSTPHLYQQYQQYLNTNPTAWQPHEINHQYSIANQYSEKFNHQMQVSNFESGLILSRLSGSGRGAYTSRVEHFTHNCSLFVMLSGSAQFTLNNQDITVGPEQIWLVKGDWHNVTETITTTNGQLSTIHLDFSLPRLQRWYEEGLLRRSLYQPLTAQENNIVKLANNIKPVKYFANKLLQQSYHTNDLSHLDLEINTLTLAAQLLRLYLNEKISRKQRSQIDEAVDIILAEFNQPLTINALARRVGINECYLKKYFKAQTGETINQFIRRLRLEIALELLTEQNKSIRETMFFVGYNHCGHFNEIFTRHFGFPPKEAKCH